MFKRKAVRIVLALAVLGIASQSHQAYADDGCTDDDSTLCSVTGSDPQPTHPNAVMSLSEEIAVFLLTVLHPY